MKIFGNIAQGLFIVCLPLLFITASLTWTINSLWLYKSGFEKYNVSATTGLTEEEMGKTAQGLISYFNSGDEYIRLTVIKDGQPFQLFNQREIIHLKDVKELFWLNYRVFLGVVAYALAYKLVCLFWQRKTPYLIRAWRRLAWGVVSGSSITLVLMLVLGAGALLGEEQFARFFFQFHLFSFANDMWLLDPTKDYLVMLFPQGFWFDTTRFCVLATAGMAMVFGGLAGSFLFLSKKDGVNQAPIRSE